MPEKPAEEKEAKPVEKPAEAKPEVKPEAVPEPTPAVPKAEAVKAPAPVSVPVATVVPPAENAPDAETKKALESAMNADVSPERVKIATEIAQQEEVRRKALEIDGRKAMEAGDQSWKEGDYASAGANYKAAYAKLPMAPTCMAFRNRAAQRIPECDYQVVRGMIKEGKDAEALARAEEFIQQHPNPQLKALIAKLKERQVEVAKTPVAEEHLGETEIQKQMRLGKEAMATRDYPKSRACFESVLALEPENREAMRYLKVLGDREYSNRTAERDATTRKMTAQVRDAWNPKYKVIKGRDVAPAVTNSVGLNVVEEKMKKIVIDEIEFRQANMHDVVDFLNKRSRDCDKSTDDDTKKGVNIILNLGPTTAATPAATPAKTGGDDVFGAPAEGEKGAGGSSGTPEVTFSARYITLYNALKIITSVAGLKWRVDGEVVMIIPLDWDPANTIEMRMYPVEPTFIERVKVASAEMPATTTVGGKEVKTMEAGNVEGQVGDLKAYFENMGVKFPKGASITYNSTIGKVIVANTVDNLTTFEKILAELNVVPKQVEIEARFVEVNETDLTEAGLEWLLNDNWEMLMKNNANPYAPLSSNPRIQMNANSADGGVTKGLRFFGADSSGQNTTMVGGKGSMGSLASIAGILTNPDLTMIIHALEQNGNADLLSAPKVTTRSGAEATIKVVTEFIYPTSFEVQGGQMQSSFNTGGNNSAGIIQETTVLPQDFATREVGVILNVMPEVSPDGNMINLTMKPQVVTEPTWYQYGSTVKRADGSTMQMNMPQPFFHVRMVETQISIYDGATVAMGGLITEELDKTNDKIPILGDIPLIGALFRSKTEQSVKKNLIIFVTAKLVDPAGQPIHNTEPDANKTATSMGPAGK